jgi:putative spermidine/putrescine transport system substrate-binding protein
MHLLPFGTCRRPAERWRTNFRRIAPRPLGWLSIALVAGLAAACGSPAAPSSNSGGNATCNSTQFPKSTYPPSYYCGLSGSAVVYDPSGGTVAVAEENSVFKDFTTLTGVNVTDEYEPDVSKLEAAEQNGGSIPWDVVVIPSVADFNTLQKEGYLQKLDTGVVSPSLLDPGQETAYGVDAQYYTANIVWNTKTWPLSGPHPTSITDIFNTKEFPGKRCLYGYPEFGGTLEAALLADGVKPADLYPLNINAALKKLDSIKSQTVWWTSGATEMQDFASGECSIGIAWPGRVLSQVQAGTPLAVGWGDAIAEYSVLAVPKGAPSAKLGNDLIGMWIRDAPGEVKYVDATTYVTKIQALNSTSDYPSSLTSWLPVGANAATLIDDRQASFGTSITALVDSFDTWLSS